MRYFYKIFFLLMILSCCGGGTSAPDSIVPPTQNILPQPLFQESPIKLIDAVSYYSQACNKPSFQFLIPLKIKVHMGVIPILKMMQVKYLIYLT